MKPLSQFLSQKEGVDVWLIKHLSDQINEKLNTALIFQEGTDMTFLLRRPRSFSCATGSWSFYHLGVASLLLFAVVCKEAGRHNKLVKKASSVVWLKLDSLELVAERMTDKIKAIRDDPLHVEQMVWCKMECLTHSFVSAAITMYNISEHNTAPPPLPTWQRKMIMAPIVLKSQHDKTAAQSNTNTHSSQPLYSDYAHILHYLYTRGPGGIQSERSMSGRPDAVWFTNKDPAV